MKSSLNLLITAIAFFCLSLCSLSAATITSAVNKNSNAETDVYLVKPAGMVENALVHIDRTTQFFSTLPDELSGLDFVMTANDDKNATGLELDLTLNPPAKLYLSIDSRMGNNIATNPPVLGSSTSTQWIIDQGWELTTNTWEKIGDLGKPYTVYSLVCFTNQITLYGQNTGGNMYSVAAEPYTNAITPYAFVDIGTTPQRTEPGWKATTNSYVSYSNNTNYGPATIVSRVFDSFKLSTDKVDWRDRGDSTNATDLVRVAEDFIKDNAGQISITLDNLRKGHYTGTSYHIDCLTNQAARIQVYVSDCASSNRLQNTQGDANITLGSVNKLTTQNITDTSASFEFWADGTNSVILRFCGTPGVTKYSGDYETPLNGFKLIHDSTFYPPEYEKFALIDIGPDSQRYWTNSIPLPGAPAGESNNINYGPTELTADDGSTFTLAIDNRNTNDVAVGAIDWRDRGDSINTNNLSRMAEDFVKNNLGMVHVTLGDLDAGTYRIVGFHCDSSNQQCENIQVYIYDAVSTNALQELSGDADLTQKGINGLTEQNVYATASTFEITSNGSDDIHIYFDGTTAVDDEVPLNGLLIERVIDTSLPPVYPKETLIILR